jgi:hypothetical protein
VRRLLAALAAALLVALAAAGGARADGDPASDFLYLGTLFPSLASPANGKNGNELRGLLKAARADGLPIKVALISTKTDLGQYPQLFSTPQRYADLLASEIAIYKALKAPVIVVTPNGLAAAGREPRGKKFVDITHARAAQLLAGIATPPHADGETLAGAAIDAVRQVAKADGHPLPEHVQPVGSSGSPTPQGKKGINGWLVAGIVAALFFAAWLVFEIVATIRERRRRNGEEPEDEPGSDPEAESPDA